MTMTICPPWALSMASALTSKSECLTADVRKCIYLMKRGSGMSGLSWWGHSHSSSYWCKRGEECCLFRKDWGKAKVKDSSQDPPGHSHSHTKFLNTLFQDLSLFLPVIALDLLILQLAPPRQPWRHEVIFASAPSVLLILMLMLSPTLLLN